MHGSRLPVSTARNPRITPSNVGDHRLLEDAVGQAEQHRAEHNRPPAVAQAAETRENEAAEGQFLADRRHDRQ